VSLLCRELAKDFVVSGTASESLYGACESMFKPNMVCISRHFNNLFSWCQQHIPFLFWVCLILWGYRLQGYTFSAIIIWKISQLDIMLLFSVTKEPEELVETISQALLSSVDRDCLSGWGGYVLLL
jgi:hypothetical protein